MLLVLFNSTRALAGVAAGQGHRRRATGGAPVRRWSCIWESRLSPAGWCASRVGGRPQPGRGPLPARFGHRAPCAPWPPVPRWSSRTRPSCGCSVGLPRVGPRSRTVGPCAPLGCRRDRKCDPVCTAGPRARIGGRCGRWIANRRRAWGRHAAPGQDSRRPVGRHPQGSPGVGRRPRGPRCRHPP